MPTVSSGKDYHVITRYDRYRMKGHHLDWAHQPDPFKSYDGIHRIPLPEVTELPAVSLWDLDGESHPHDPAAGIDLKRLARILLFGYGITAKARQPGRDFFFRSAASAGALYPVEVYLAAFDVSDLDPGLYHYDIRHRTLGQLRKGDFKRPAMEALLDTAADRVAACFFISGIFFRSAWKYRERAMRYVLLDAGHVLENLRLSSDAEGCESAIRYDFDDERLNRFLGLDEAKETCLACLPIYGKPSSTVRHTSPIEPLPETIQSASRVSLKEIGYQEIESLCLAGRQFPENRIADSDIMQRLGAEVLAWSPMPETEPMGDELNFSEAMLHRRSRRNYISEPLSENRFFRFLQLVNGSFNRGLQLAQLQHSPLAVGLLIEQIEGVEAGIYLMDGRNHRLGSTAKGAFTKPMATACLDQAWLKQASIHFLFMTNLAELEGAWGPRGYRYAMLLAGQIGQAIYLGATALGLGACGIGALYDEEARHLIGLNQDSALLYLVAAGRVKKI